MWITKQSEKFLKKATMKRRKYIDFGDGMKSELGRGFKRKGVCCYIEQSQEFTCVYLWRVVDICHTLLFLNCWQVIDWRQWTAKSWIPYLEMDLSNNCHCKFHPTRYHLYLLLSSYHSKRFGLDQDIEVPKYLIKPINYKKNLMYNCISVQRAYQYKMMILMKACVRLILSNITQIELILTIKMWLCLSMIHFSSNRSHGIRQ